MKKILKFSLFLSSLSTIGMYFEGSIETFKGLALLFLLSFILWVIAFLILKKLNIEFL